MKNITRTRKMRKRGKIILIFIFIFLVAIMLMAYTSAGFFDWFKKTITGRATTQETNVSIAVAGTNPVTIDWIWNESLAGTAVTPTEKSTTSIHFNVTISDTDGVNDINDSSVRAEFINGTDIRVNDTCADLVQETTTSANYSCSIDMWYWDISGPWVINVTANDLGVKDYVSNYSEAFVYAQLQAIEISPESLTWASVAPGAENQTSNNDPTILNNTGNYNVTTGNVKVNAINLYGETGAFIGVGNFSVDLTTGAGNPECVGTNAPTNGTDLAITNALLPTGNLSETTPVSQEELYYCVVKVPSDAPSQTYSTQTAGSMAWVVKIT